MRGKPTKILSGLQQTAAISSVLHIGPCWRPRTVYKSLAYVYSSCIFIFANKNEYIIYVRRRIQFNAHIKCLCVGMRNDDVSNSWNWDHTRHRFFHSPLLESFFPFVSPSLPSQVPTHFFLFPALPFSCFLPFFSLHHSFIIFLTIPLPFPAPSSLLFSSPIFISPPLPSFTF